MRILLAEDNPINQEVTVEMLESQGHSVDVAENGREALRIWREQRPDLDLILMDLRMPDINGLEATTQIRGEEREDEHISIIALTAHAIEGAREEAFDAGMDGYLAKPLRQEQLYEALEEYAETRKFPEQGVEPIESE
jgi:CheY-like chemotaxis protein